VSNAVAARCRPCLKQLPLYVNRARSGVVASQNGYQENERLGRVGNLRIITMSRLADYFVVVGYDHGKEREYSRV